MSSSTAAPKRGGGRPVGDRRVTDTSGHTFIPESVRPDGSVRKAIRVREGYIPPEEVATYESPGQRRAYLAARARGGGPVGAVYVDTHKGAGAPAKPRADAGPAPEKAAAQPTLKKAAGTASGASEAAALAEKMSSMKLEKAASTSTPAPVAGTVAAAGADAGEDADPAKRAKRITKALRQIAELEDVAAGGKTLNAEQLAKIARKGALQEELRELGGIGHA